MKKYVCKVVQSCSREIEFEVEAKDEADAEAKAQKEVSHNIGQYVDTGWGTDYIEIEEGSFESRAVTDSPKEA